jgi:hypothetical protein
MSALVMALAASMAVGSGPAAVSSEVEQSLDLSGEWEGTFRNSEGACLLVRFGGGKLDMPGDGKFPCTFTDEGEGRVRVRVDDEALHGIFEQSGHRVVCCLADTEDPRPTAFQLTKGRVLLILHRVKPRK